MAYINVIASCILGSVGGASSNMTSSYGNIFGVTAHLCGEFTGDRWIPLTNASDTEFDFFIYAWITGWVSNGEAGDLRRHRSLSDVTEMFLP